jgi:hypothetical protein
MPCTLPSRKPRVGMSRDRTQYIPLDGSGRGFGSAGSGAGSSWGRKRGPQSQ